jgi:hypothetical protein
MGRPCAFVQNMGVHYKLTRVGTTTVALTSVFRPCKRAQRVWRLLEPSDNTRTVMRPMGLGTMNHCAGEGQQHFSSQSVIPRPRGVLPSVASTRWAADMRRMLHQLARQKFLWYFYSCITAVPLIRPIQWCSQHPFRTLRWRWWLVVFPEV